jgi:hypothetical protein
MQSQLPSDIQHVCLQSQLLDRLEAAQDVARWQATTPTGLDLEYCMSRSTALSCSLRALGATHLAILLEDDRTMVFSENTCLALVLEYMQKHPSISTADKKALMQAVRWKWLSSGFICSLAGSAFIPARMQDQLRQMAMFEPGVREALLQYPPAHPYILPTVLKGRRPDSSVQKFEFDWEVSCEALQTYFGTDTRIDTEAPLHVFAGFSWGARLAWIQSTADSGAWYVQGPEVVARTAAGDELPDSCVVGGEFEATIAGEHVLPRTKGCWQADASFLSLSQDAPGEGLTAWPERSEAGEHLPARIQGGKLRGCIVIHEVL